VALCCQRPGGGTLKRCVAGADQGGQDLVASESGSAYLAMRIVESQQSGKYACYE